MGCCWRNYCCHTDYFVCVRVIMRTRKRNLVNFVLAIAVPILYLSNNYFFKWHTSGFLHYLLVCHFNDFLASLLLLSFSNLLLETVNKEISSFPAVLLLCLLAGFVWEYIAPIWKRTATTDLLDVAAYIIGGLFYWVLLKTLVKNGVTKNASKGS